MSMNDYPQNCPPQKCPLCPSDLRKHLKTHGGKKLNKCSKYNNASFVAGDLRKHLKRHSGEKSNKCNQCDYASFWAGNLRNHLKTHSEKVKQVKPM